MLQAQTDQRASVSFDARLSDNLDGSLLIVSDEGCLVLSADPEAEGDQLLNLLADAFGLDRDDATDEVAEVSITFTRR